MTKVSNHRIDKLSKRADHRLLTKLFLNQATQWESNKARPYQKIYTCLQKLPAHQLVQTIDQIMRDSLWATLGTETDALPEEVDLRNALLKYTEIKTAKRTFPLVMANGEEDADRE